MKHRLFKLALFLFLGAIVNIAVAWGCAWLLDVYQYPRTSKIVDVAGVDGVAPYHTWNVDRYERAGALRVFSFYYFGFSAPIEGDDPEILLPPWDKEYFSGIQVDEMYSGLVRIQDGRGWPMLSLWGQAVAYANKPSSSQYEIEHGLLLTDDITDPSLALGFARGSTTGLTLWFVQFLPLHPIWPGFAINTFFYASILWLIILGPFKLRRTIRCKRGLCIQCGYDLRGTDHIVCPECGTKLSPPFSPG